MKKIYRLFRRAFARHSMLAPGDRVCIAVSGGMDSMALATIMKEYHHPIPVEFFAVHVDQGFTGWDPSFIEDYMKEIELPLKVVKTDTARELPSAEAPCFLCSFERRKTIFYTAEELGCNKIAYAHTRDDVVENILMNVLYHGEFASLSPNQPFFEGHFYVIRPLFYVDKELIKEFVKEKKIPYRENPCPYKHDTKREKVRRLLKELVEENPEIKHSIFASQFHIKREFLP